MKNLLFASLVAVGGVMAGAATVSPVLEKGSIAWLEIRVLNLERAKAFYGGMFGWTFQAAGPVVALFSAPNIEGMLNQEQGHAAGFSSMIAYFKVPAVRPAYEQALRLGAASVITPRPIPGKGSFCMVTDPEGNFLGLVSDEPAP